VISPSQRTLPDNICHPQQTDIHAPGGIRTHNPSRQATADRRLRLSVYWDRLIVTFIYTYLWIITQNFIAGQVLRYLGWCKYCGHPGCVEVLFYKYVTSCLHLSNWRELNWLLVGEMWWGFIQYKPKKCAFSKRIFQFMMSSTWFKTEVLSSGRQLYIQVWYIIYSMCSRHN